MGAWASGGASPSRAPDRAREEGEGKDAILLCDETLRYETRVRKDEAREREFRSEKGGDGEDVEGERGERGE